MDHPRARDAVLTAYAQSLIKIKACQLSEKPGFSRSDEDDFIQELTLHLLSQAGRFDRNRGSENTFDAQVIESQAAMIVRHRRRQKRAAGFAAQSLELTCMHQDGETASLRDMIKPADLRRRTGGNDRDQTERNEAVVIAFQSLPPNLQVVASRLSEDTQTAVARELGISRRQLRNIIERIRRHFEQSGFRES